MPIYRAAVDTGLVPIYRAAVDTGLAVPIYSPDILLVRMMSCHSPVCPYIGPQWTPDWVADGRTCTLSQLYIRIIIIIFYNFPGPMSTGYLELLCFDYLVILFGLLG